MLRELSNYEMKAHVSKSNFLLLSCVSLSAGSNGSPQQQHQNQQPDLRIRRQHSSDSVSSITSATSHSSVGSNMDADAKNKKKNKKNWVRCLKRVRAKKYRRLKISASYLSLSVCFCSFLCVCWWVSLF